jgi:hypothetical protein
MSRDKNNGRKAFIDSRNQAWIIVVSWIHLSACEYNNDVDFNALNAQNVGQCTKKKNSK